MGKQKNNYKFDFFNKLDKDPIFSQFVQDVVKWLIGLIIGFSVVKVTVVPMFKKEDDEIEIKQDTVAVNLFTERYNNKNEAMKGIKEHRILDYVDTISYPEHKTFIALDDSIQLYVENLDKFDKYEIHLSEQLLKNNSYSKSVSFDELINRGSRLTASKYNIINDFLLIVHNPEIYKIALPFSEEELNELISKTKQWENELLSRKKQRETVIGLLHNDYESFGGNDSDGFCRKELMMKTNELNLIGWYNSNDYYEIEAIFLDLIVKYNNHVRVALKEGLNNNGRL